MNRQSFSRLLVQLAVLQVIATVPAYVQAATGLSVSAEAFKANLLHIKDNVLPAGWQLAAVQKWNAYGNGISQLAGIAAQLQLPVCVLTNAEAQGAIAAAEAAGGKPQIWRIMPADGPAKYPEIFAAAKSGLGIQESMAPSNQKDILAAAKAAGVVIPVHIYLFSHYTSAYGYYFKNSQQLQDLVKGLDPQYIKVVGFMTHNGGLGKSQALKRIDSFNKLVCPVAKPLAQQQPLVLHFASSSDMYTLMPQGGSRIQAPAGLCEGPGITWMARIGSMTYGDDREDSALLRNGTSPVLTWNATVSYIHDWAASAAGGKARKVAVVDLAPHRYPGTTWWKGVEAFEPESDETRDSAASRKPAKPSQLWQGAGYQPDSFVYINGHRYRLASIPTSGAQILVDVTKGPAGALPVRVGDSVCLLCAQHPIGDLGKEVGADGYNTALCLTGQQPVVGSLEETPQCNVA